MDPGRIAVLLEPFLGGEPPSPLLARQLQTYLDVLLRWNARMNLTAVRDPEQIVTRHFGESLFAARVLRDAGVFASPPGTIPTQADVGSGPGFPGIPIKLAIPEIQLTLIESQNKKATFLREVFRALDLHGGNVFCGRAENWQHTANVVTLRAVEKFDTSLPVAAALVATGGAICLLIGNAQAQLVPDTLGPRWDCKPPLSIPDSNERVVLVAHKIAK